LPPGSDLLAAGLAAVALVRQRAPGHSQIHTVTVFVPVPGMKLAGVSVRM
jgi:hypothetical protein